MSHGARVWDASGTLIFDSETAEVGCIAEVVAVAPGDPAQTKTYPEFSGRGVVVMTLSGDSSLGVTADILLGYPRVVFPANGYSHHTFMVFIT